VAVPEWNNKIPATRTLLAQLDVTGKRVLADASHAQEATAQQILNEGGGEYLLTVQGNQDGLVQTLEGRLTEQSLSPFSRSHRPTPSRGSATADGARFAGWTAGR
jgi:predicted transposase YbfD/YdcC